MAEPDPQLAAIAKAVLPLGPGAAGALLSLALAEQLTVRGKLLSAVGGLASAAFVAPAVTLMLNPIIPGETVPVAVANLVGFLSGTFGMIVLTGLAKALALYTSDPLKLVKVNLPGVQIGGAE